MPPKGKRSGSTKVSAGEGKRRNTGKSAKKNEGGSSDENGTEVKIPSRQSKRNINKVVTYKDEDFSDDEAPPRKGGKDIKKRKHDENSDVSDELNSEDDVKPKARNQSNKRKPKTQDSDEDEQDSEDDAKPKARNQSNKRKPKTQDSDEDEQDSENDAKPKARNQSNKRKPKTQDSDEDEQDSEDDAKPKSRNQSNKRKPKTQDSDEDEQEEDEEAEEEEEKLSDESETKKPKLKEKKDQSSGTKKPKIDKPLLNKTESNFESLDFSSDKTTSDGKCWNLKISSWNVGGLKAWVKKSGIDYIKYEKPDILCLQETKCSESKLPPEVKVDGYHTYWLSGDKEGYAGVALYSKEEPIKVTYGLGKEEYDNEGRVITAEYEKFYLVAAYVPNAGRGLVTLPKRMKWDPDLRSYVKELDSKKPVILCGDMNVSHEAIDLANPKTNTKNAGFTQEERDGMTALLEEGFVDSFRHLYPEKTGAYTFWTYMGNARSRNTGWRLDYFILSKQLVPNLCDNVIRSEVYGSDHCPITLLIHI